MSTFQQILDEDRRLVILRTLSEADDYQLNEGLLEKMLAHLRIGIVGRDLIRAQLAWLETHGLVTIDRLAMGDGRDLWVGRLTKVGQEVARGRQWPGVARPSPA